MASVFASVSIVSLFYFFFVLVLGSRGKGEARDEFVIEKDI